MSGKMKLFLDLDNTLISSEPLCTFDSKKYKNKAVKFDFHDMEDYYVVFERPGLQEFLDYAFPCHRPYGTSPDGSQRRGLPRPPPGRKFHHARRVGTARWLPDCRLHRRWRRWRTTRLLSGLLQLLDFPPGHRRRRPHPAGGHRWPWGN